MMVSLSDLHGRIIGENIENDNDPLHCVYKTRLRVAHKDHRQVCIKAVDVFGFESQVIEEV